MRWVALSTRDDPRGAWDYTLARRFPRLMPRYEAVKNFRPVDGGVAMGVGWLLFVIGLLGLVVIGVTFFRPVFGVSNYFDRYVFLTLLAIMTFGSVVAYVGRYIRGEAKRAWDARNSDYTLKEEKAREQGMLSALRSTMVVENQSSNPDRK